MKGEALTFKAQAFMLLAEDFTFQHKALALERIQSSFERERDFIEDYPSAFKAKPFAPQSDGFCILRTEAQFLQAGARYAQMKTALNPP